MQLFDLGFHRILRFWVDEDVARIQSNKTIVKDFKSENFITLTSKAVICELMIPRGGRNIYGLLGLKYFSNHMDYLEVSLQSGSQNHSRNFPDSLLKDNVFIGIPDEYKDEIFSVIEDLNIKKSLSFCGKVDFCYGAYNQISSSEWVFRKLTRLLIAFLLKEKSLALQDITQIIDDL